MAYFYHTINNDFAIADNVERNYADQWNKLSRMTSTRDMYCVHIVSGTCHLDLNGHIVELHEKDFVVLMQGCFIRTIDHSADLTFFVWLPEIRCCGICLMRLAFIWTPVKE